MINLFLLCNNHPFPHGQQGSQQKLDIIGDSEFSTLFGPGGQLEGYNLSSIKLNGEESSAQDIQQIITDIQQGNSEVIDYTVD